MGHYKQQPYVLCASSGCFSLVVNARGRIIFGFHRDDESCLGNHQKDSF
jgi:hypothetical protein